MTEEFTITSSEDKITVTIDSLKRDLLDNPPWLYTLIAEVNNSIAGYALLCPLSHVQFGLRGLDLHHLYVKSDFRRKGVAHCLIKKSLQHAINLNCSFVQVGTNPDNLIAQKLYGAVGFVEKNLTAPLVLYTTYSQWRCNRQSNFKFFSRLTRTILSQIGPSLTDL